MANYYLYFLVFLVAGKIQGRIRQPHFLSIVNVVRFSNSECRGSLIPRNGTCLTNLECQNEGGTFAGHCAAGFGTCCLFDAVACGAVVTRNCTYVSNPEFPSPRTVAGECDYAVRKCGKDVCALRLDFETFAILGPQGTVEIDGGACLADTFQVADSLSPLASVVPVICGENSGQHIYVDLTQGEGSEEATLKFVLSGVGDRRWQIKVTQIGCHSSNRPPTGCLQYFTSLTGQITTFNFSPADGTTNLANQQYSVCLARHEGFCCVSYSVCPDVTGAFTIDNADAAGSSRRDDACIGDYISIEASGDICNQGNLASTLIANKYCGRTLNALTGMTTDSQICDCSPPFTVGVFTDDRDSTVPANTRDRGVCLQYSYQKCL